MDKLETAYLEAEEYFLLPAAKGLDNPHCIFVFASPGAGKSVNVKKNINRKLAGEKPVNLEADALKSFVPAGEPIDEVVAVWFKRLTDKIIEQKRNVLIFRQRNMLELPQTFGIYKKAKENGYTTQAVFLAIDKKRSRLGMIHRYEMALEKAAVQLEFDRENYPRKPSFFRHYVFYKAIPIALRVLSRSRYPDKIEVCDREGRVLAFKDRISGDESIVSPLTALRRERRRHLTEKERHLFDAHKQEAEMKMRGRGVSEKDIRRMSLWTRFSRNKQPGRY